MVLYRRNRVKGGCYFFTVTLQDGSSRLLVEHIAELRDAFRQAKARMPFQLEAIVVFAHGKIKINIKSSRISLGSIRATV